MRLTHLGLLAALLCTDRKAHSPNAHSHLSGADALIAADLAKGEPLGTGVGADAVLLLRNGDAFRRLPLSRYAHVGAALSDQQRRLYVAPFI